MIPSDTPVSRDAPFVTKPFDPADMHHGVARAHSPMQRIVQGIVGAAEYGDLATVTSSDPVGTYKRAYSTIIEGMCCLTTGFDIGSLDLKWVAQVQTGLVVEGYIEGPPHPCGELLCKSASRGPSIIIH